MPPLLLQPLVENAIQHGLEPKVEGGRITVRASQQGADLVLEVTDTGLGHTTDAAHPGSGFGLAQVRERLATTYGDKASFELIAENPCGTSARVRIQLQNS